MISSPACRLLLLSLVAAASRTKYLLVEISDSGARELLSVGDNVTESSAPTSKSGFTTSRTSRRLDFDDGIASFQPRTTSARFFSRASRRQFRKSFGRARDDDDDNEVEEVEDVTDMMADEPDLVLNAKQVEQFFSDDRTGISDPAHRWEGGVVPYNDTHLRLNDPELYDHTVRDIKAFNKMFHGCIKFRPYNPQDKFIVQVKRGPSCRATMGKFSNTHLQLKSDTCFFHEAMHTLGFTHEFNAVDRNKYVNVHFNNVREGLMNNFNIHPTYQNNEGIEYNPYSRMNYGVNFLAKDKTKPTLVQKATTGAEIEGVGTAYLLAHSDQQKIRRMYGCKELETRCPRRKMDRIAEHACTKVITNVKKSWHSAVFHCKRKFPKGRLYEPRDYEAFAKIRKHYERLGVFKRGESFWVGTRKTSDGKRTVHVSDSSPRNFHMFCGDFYFNEELKAKRINCRIKKPERECIALTFKDRKVDDKVVIKGRWRFNYHGCNEKRHFICEVPPTPTKAAKRSSTTKSKRRGRRSGYKGR